MFRTVPLSIIRSFSLYTQQWYMPYRFADSLRAVSKPVWHIPLLSVQCKTPDDGQRNCPKHVEFYSKNKFEKLVHLVGFFIIRLETRYLMFSQMGWLRFKSTIMLRHVNWYLPTFRESVVLQKNRPFDSDDGDTPIIRKNLNCLPVDTAWYCRRLESWTKNMWKKEDDKIFENKL